MQVDFPFRVFPKIEARFLVFLLSAIRITLTLRKMDVQHILNFNYFLRLL